MRESLKIVLFFVAGLILGIVISRALAGSAVVPEWDNKLGWDSVVELFSALVIGLILQRTFQKSVASSRVEQDMLIGSLTDSLRCLREIKTEFRTCQLSQLPSGSIKDRIIPLLRLISNNLTATKDLLECLGYQQFDAKCDELLLNVVIYKQTLTDDPDKTYSAWHSAKHEEYYRKITKETYELIVRLNRL
jgi:hypothetical protein